MGENQSPDDQQRSQADAELEREIRSERKFTLTEAIGRMAGPGSMKGASPVTRKQQVVSEIETWLRHHLSDAPGALQCAMLQRISESEALLNTSDPPLTVLATFCRRVRDSEQLLAQLVRVADVEWGRAFDERPYFDKEGSPPSPEDPYTIESVRRDLSGLIEQLAAATK
jgi:hypothetical protein